MYSIVLLISSWLSILLSESPDGFIKNYQTHVSFVKGKMIVSKRLLAQINNAEGNSFAEIQIGYSETNSISNLSASILNISGQKIRSLKNKNIRDRNYISGYNSYSDYRIKEFDLIHNEYPYLLEYSYDIEYDQFIFEKWYPNYKNLYTKEAELIIEYPHEFQIQIISDAADSINPKMSKSETIKQIWSFSDINRIEEENQGPNWKELSPSISIIPETFFYGFEGHSSSWQDYGNWVNSLSMGHNDLSPEQISKVKAKVAGIHDKKEIAKILFNDLQDEMRYVNISMDIGGMKPFPASFVEQNKYGDCKALTYYMKSLLELFAIQAYPVDVYWSSNPMIINENAYTQQFNHVFLCVPIDGDTVWLENTSQTQPFNYIDTNKQGEKGLLIKNGASRLITLPKQSIEDVKSVMVLELKLQEDDVLLGKLDATYRGDKFETFSYINQNWQKSDQDSWMKRNLRPKSSELYSWDFSTRDRNKPFIEMSASLDFSNQTKKYGSNLVVFVPDSDLPNLEPPSQRKYDFRYRVPLYNIDTITFELDTARYSKTILPETQLLLTDFADYKIKFDKKDNIIKCIRSLKIHSNTFTPGESYKKIYKFIEDIKAIERQTYIQLRQ
ncbi:MAG: DUF3857 domain-containing protein [Reichenbachiella sp.]|uniref:DUF3857 domain-containing protein n=1 Tax=Reichenbachiella sp. TaxID=2184521 RepID=UPI00329734E4